MNRLPIYLALLIAAVVMPAVLVGCKAPSGEPAKAEAPKDTKEAAAKGDTHDKEGEKGKEGDKEKPPSLDEAKGLLTKRDAAADVEAIKKLSQIAGGSAGEIRDAAIQILRELASTSEAPNVRAQAVAALAADPIKSFDVIVKATKDPDPSVRAQAAQTIAASSSSAAESILAEMAQKDGDPVVQQAATVGLTALRAAKTGGEFGPLIAQLAQPNGDGAAQAAIALTLKGDAALGALTTCLRQSGSARQRHGAAICIAMICAGANPTEANFARLAKATSRESKPPRKADLRGVEPLIAALKDPDPNVREIAAQGLGYLGDERAAEPLAAALSDPDALVRRRAASALITVPAKPALAALAKTVSSDPSPAVRRFAAEALGWIRDPGAIEPLIKAASDPSPEVRRYAAMQLGRLGDKRAVTALTQLFDDTDVDVRWAAVLAVGGMRDRQAQDALVKALNDPAPQVANAAERALQRLGIAKRKLEPSERGYNESRG